MIYARKHILGSLFSTDFTNAKNVPHKFDIAKLFEEKEKMFTDCTNARSKKPTYVETNNRC